MLIPNITTEFKDSNGTLRVVWDMYIDTNKFDWAIIKDARSVGRISKVHFIAGDTKLIFSISDILSYTLGKDWLSNRLLAWAAPQTIEQLKAKLAF